MSIKKKKGRFDRNLPPLKRSSSEQKQILGEFERLWKGGLDRIDAADAAGASLASIYRWRSKFERPNSTPRATRAQDITIDCAIARLADPEDTNRQTFLESLFKFIAWLRWPIAPEEHAAAITASMITYLSYGRAGETLDNLPTEELNMLLRHIRIGTLRMLCTQEMPTFPIFDLFDIRNQPYKETDFIAEVVHFILSFKPLTLHTRDKVSLNKAYHASQNNVFRYRWPISQSTFRIYWSRYAAAAPFLYVERYHNIIDFNLNPIDDDFALIVDDIIQNPHGLRRHLARCKSAVQLLNSCLDKRATNLLQFPSFPADLDPEPLNLKDLPSQAYVAMRSFGRRDNR